MASHGLLAQLAIVGAAAGAGVVAAQAESVDVLRDNVQLAQEGASVLTAAAGIVSALSKGEMRAELAWREVIPYMATWLDIHGYEGRSWLATEEEDIDMDKTEKGLALMSSIVVGVDYPLHGLYLKKWWRYNTGDVATVVVVERASTTCKCALVTLPSPTMASLLKSRVGSSHWEIVDGCKVSIKCSACVVSGTAAWSLFDKAVKDVVDDMGKPTEQRKYPCSLCSTGADRSSYIWNYRISQIIASAEEKMSGKLTTAQLKATQDTRDLMSFKGKFNTSTRAKYVGIIVEGVTVMALCWAIKAPPLLSASIGRRMVRGNVVGMNMTSCLPAEFADTVTVLKEEATADAWLIFTMDPTPSTQGRSFLHIPRMARIRLITAWIILSNLGGMAIWVACTSGFIRPLLGQETSAIHIETWQTIVLSVFCVFAGVAGKLYRIHVAPYQAPQRLISITQTLKKPRSIALILVGLGLLVLLLLGRVWHGSWLGSLRTAIIGTEVANILCWWIVEWVSIPSARNPAAPLRGQVVSQPCTYLTESVIGFVQGHLA